MATRIEYDDTYENGVLVERVEVEREIPITDDDREAMIAALEASLDGATNVAQLRSAVRDVLGPILRELIRR